jgi:tetratricopeptide (TPR) repeat protein
MQEKIGDIYKSKGKLIDTLDPYARSLKGKLTPLQRLRVIMKAAPLFANMGRAEEAYALYQEVLKEHPDFAEKKFLYEKLSEVATRLKKTGEAAEYQRLARENARL